MERSRKEKLSELHDLYRDPKSNLFLVRDTKRIYHLAKSHARLSDLTFGDVYAFKQSIESLARTKSDKILRGRRRYSFRKYRLFGSSVISGDLCFIPRLSKSDDDGSKNKTHGILAIFMDCFSRLISLNFQKDTKSSTTLATFEKAWKEDFNGKQFHKFLSDRGTRKRKG